MQKQVGEMFKFFPVAETVLNLYHFLPDSWIYEKN